MIISLVCSRDGANIISMGTATSQHGALDRDGRLPSSSDTVLRLSHVDTLAQAIDTKEIEK